MRQLPHFAVGFVIIVLSFAARQALTPRTAPVVVESELLIDGQSVRSPQPVVVRFPESLQPGERWLSPRFSVRVRFSEHIAAADPPDDDAPSSTDRGPGSDAPSDASGIQLVLTSATGQRLLSRVVPCSITDHTLGCLHRDLLEPTDVSRFQSLAGTTQDVRLEVRPHRLVNRHGHPVSSPLLQASLQLDLRGLQPAAP